MLVHDIRQRSIWMIGQLLPALVAEGYRFVTLDEVPGLDQYRTPPTEDVPMAMTGGGYPASALSR